MERKDFIIVAGSYERLLYGLAACWVESKEKDILIESKPNNGMEIEIKPVFIFPAHAACIKAVACGGKYLASGSTDEIIKLYDIKKLREIGHLSQQLGTITCLAFYKQSHLISASEDGSICIFRTKDWELLKILKGHKDRVNVIAIHPSGKLALSTGKDKTLRMWDLITGHQAFKNHLKNEVEKILWSSDGKYYVLIYSNSCVIFNEKGEEFYTVMSKTKILCVVFVGLESIVFSGEDKLFHFIDFSKKTESILESKHVVRIREIAILNEVLVSCSSDGVIKCWKIENENSLRQIGEYNTDVRLTCLTLSENK